MVQAIIEGRKTQTRRIIKPQPILEGQRDYGDSWAWKKGKKWFSGVTTEQLLSEIGLCHESVSTYGIPGDHLWVRETWGVGTRPHPVEGWVDGIEYKADEKYCDDREDLTLYSVETPDGISIDDYYSTGWKSPIFMPKWASRITLEIKKLRAERLQDISDQDCFAEGLIDQVDGVEKVWPKEWYMNLWSRINGRDSWDQNPFVWVIEFSVLDQ